MITPGNDANITASSLLKPDMQISRIRLSQRHVADDPAPKTGRRGASPESPPLETGWLSHNGSKLQVDLFPFCVDMSLAGSLRSTGITRRLHYYGPLRLPTEPTSGYLFPKAVGVQTIPTGLPGSSTDLSTPAVPYHPGEPDRCKCSLLHGRCQASPSLGVWPPSKASRGRTGFTCVTADVFTSTGFDTRVTPSIAVSATCRTSNSHG